MAFKTGGRKCKFESLENRQMMAGDVVGSVHAGTLTLRGDNFGNGITITAGALPNSVLVTGVTQEGSPTNLDGVSNGATTYFGVTRGVTVKMKAGNDFLDIQDITINGLTKINMGIGVNEVNIDDAVLCKGLFLKTGRHADTVTITDTEVTGKATIKTGADCDHVTLEDSVFGALSVNLNEDNDELTTEHISVTTETNLDGGWGINIFNDGMSNFYGGIYNRSRLNG